MVGKYFLIWRMKRRNIKNIYYNFPKLRQWFEENFNNIFFFSYFLLNVWILTNRNVIFISRRKNAWPTKACRVWKSTSLELFITSLYENRTFPSQKVFIHTLVHSGTRNSIKIYRGSSKSICNLRYMLSITCVFYPISIGLLIKLKQDA